MKTHILFFLSALFITGANASNFTFHGLGRALDHTSQCPTGYNYVSPTWPYTFFPFCVAKYEMKNSSGNAVSQASGSPWVNINRANARAACKAIGPNFDLMTNAQWQTLARTLVDVGWNWSDIFIAYNDYISGTNNQMPTGHSDNSPSNSLPASSDDNDSYFNTGNPTGWNSQKRTMITTLVMGDTYWDLAGNVSEWVLDDLSSLSISSYARTLTGSNQDLFGNDQDCESPNGQQCGYGFVSITTPNGVVRGGNYSSGTSISGIFSATSISATSISPFIGFRCVWNP